MPISQFFWIAIIALASLGSSLFANWWVTPTTVVQVSCVGSGADSTVQWQGRPTSSEPVGLSFINLVLLVLIAAP